MQIQLDGKNAETPLNGTNSVDQPTLLFTADNMGDEDHQLLVNIESLAQNGTVVVDYFECVAPLCPKKYAPTTLLP